MEIERDQFLNLVIKNSKPRENLRPSEWVAENVYLTDSPISAKFQTGNHCDDILDQMANPDTYEISVVGHTGMGKSAILEAVSCWIVAQAPGPALLIGQTDATTNQWMETRMKPAFRKCEATRHLMPSGVTRHKDRKDAIIFPSMQYLTGGANISNTQEVSMRYTLGDEPWTWKHGIIGELLKRHHDRWNRKSLLVSQGGTEESEWHKHTKDGLGFDRAYKCSCCGTVQKFRFESIKFEKHLDANDDYDWIKIFESVRYECENEHCEKTYPDTPQGRNEIAHGSFYLCRENAHIPSRVTYYVPALCNPRIQWSTLVREWIVAQDALKGGDKEPLKQFLMKRLAQFWVEKPEVPTLDTATDPYSKTLYHEGEKWEGEHARLMLIDVQKVGFWVVIRGWKIVELRSRLLWEGFIDSWQMLFEIQERYSVENRNVFIDSGYNNDEIARQMHAKFGRNIEDHWVFLMGIDNVNGYPYQVGSLKQPKKVYKIFSKYISNATTERLPYRTVHFSNLRAKDALANLLEIKQGIFGVPVDASQNYVKQMQSEHKKEIAPGKWRWKKIKDHLHNHLWDCETMGIVAASIRGILKIEMKDDK